MLVEIIPSEFRKLVLWNTETEEEAQEIFDYIDSHQREYVTPKRARQIREEIEADKEVK